MTITPAALAASREAHPIPSAQTQNAQARPSRARGGFSSMIAATSSAVFGPDRLGPPDHACRRPLGMVRWT